MRATVPLRTVTSPTRRFTANKLLDIKIDVSANIRARESEVDTTIDIGEGGSGIEVVSTVSGSARTVQNIVIVTGTEIERRTRIVETDTTTET